MKGFLKIMRIFKIPQWIARFLNRKECGDVPYNYKKRNKKTNLGMSVFLGFLGRVGSLIFVSVWLGPNTPAEGATLEDFYLTTSYFDVLDNMYYDFQALEGSDLIEPGMYLMLLGCLISLTLLPLADWGLDALGYLFKI